MQTKQKINIVWFRNDLRVRDQISLTSALKKDLPVLGVFVFQPKHYQMTMYGFKKTEKFRAKFLLQSVENLKDNLHQLNLPLWVTHQEIGKAFEEIYQTFKVEHIFYQTEWTSEEKQEEIRVKKALPETKFNPQYNQFLFHPEDTPFTNFNEIPEVFTHFRKNCEKKSKLRSEIPIPQPQKQNLEIPINKIPQLEDLGFQDFETHPQSAFPFQGGEDQAWQRLDNYFWETKKLQFYKKTRNGLLGTDYSSKFSAWLANGSISAVSIYHQIKSFEKEIKKNQDTYWLIFELIWRDYFKYVSLKHGNKIFQLGGILNRDYNWNFHPKAFQDWTAGKTPEPFVNANMKEIAATGFMSNRGRQNVNSYWAKEWKQDWRVGAAYFEALLIDYDVHSNWGNWMYNSGVGNDPRDRKFNIKTQAERYDKNGKYQQTWLQESLF